MKNIKVALDDETYRLVRAGAAKRKTSVSALVRRFLADFVTGESRGGDRLTRDEVHERDA